jgi:PKD repeat protein
MDVAHGTLALNTDGSFIYTPAGNFNGVDTFTYRVNDGAVESGIAVVTIQVVPVNDAPVAVNDEYSTDEDTSLVIAPPGVLFNDSDTEGDLLSAVLVDDTTHGTLLLENDGSFTYIPDADYNGSDGFTYRVYDGAAYSNVAVVPITVAPVRDRPVANAGGPYSANEGSPVTFDGSASYAPDGVIAAYDWEFGDGSTGAGPSPQHLYIEEGNYSVTLTVTDNEGLLDKATTFVTVNDLGPMAAFTWLPEPQTEGASITFNDQSSSSPDGIVAWYWEFGGLGSSAGQNPTFTFLDNGIYTVTLTVTDDDGSTGSVSYDVTVLDLGPIAALTGDTGLDENQTGIY